MVKEMCNIPDNVLALLQKDIAEIKVALLGNEYNPDGGLLCRTTDLEREVDELREKYTKMMNKYNKIIGAAGVAGGLMGIIIELIIRYVDKVTV